MNEQEALTRIKTGNFNGGYGFDMQLLVDAVGTLGEMFRSGQISEVVRCKNCSEYREQEMVEPNLDTDEWKCGNCGHTLEHQELLGDNMLFHEQYNYCPNCGRKVKWNDK